MFFNYIKKNDYFDKRLKFLSDDHLIQTERKVLKRLDSYELLKTTLAVSAKRAELISSNIANVNTDGYKAKRVEFESELKQALQAAGNQSSQEDILSQSTAPSNSKMRTQVLKDNGNNVDLEVEMLDQAANGLYYSALTAQINGRLQMMNYVLR